MLSCIKRLLLPIIFFAETESVLCSPVSAAVVIDAKNGKVVYSYNADERTQPASLAKMMTLLLIFKALQKGVISLGTPVRISSYAAAQQPSVLGLKSGEYITVLNAILALIVKSANDIAVAIAEHIGKSERSFVAMMNKEAARLGMKSTVFYNASGWKNPRQLTTANDIAKLARALINEHPGYYHWFSSKQFSVGDKCIKGHYRLLGKRGDIVVDGIKTGFVNASGFNLAASAVKGKKRLIAVVLGRKTTQERDKLTDFLLKKGFEKLEEHSFAVNAKKTNKTVNSGKSGIAYFLSNFQMRHASASVQNASGIYNKIYELTNNSRVSDGQNSFNTIK